MRERDIYYPIPREGLADRLREPADAEQLLYGQPPDRDHNLRPQELELAQQVRPAVGEHRPGGHLVPAAPRLPREAAGERGQVDLRPRDPRLGEPALEPPARRARERQPRRNLRQARRLPDEEDPYLFDHVHDRRVVLVRETPRAASYQLPVQLQRIHTGNRIPSPSKIWCE